MPVLARIEQVTARNAEDAILGGSVTVHVRCPRCGHGQETRANKRERCTGCGLDIEVRLHEPRCMCGYLLRGLPEPVCPECGRPLSEGEWWEPPPDRVGLDTASS